MEFDQYAEQYDAGFMGKGSTRFYRDLIRELEIRDGNAVLDVGCGTGTILEWIGKSKMIHGYGLDVSESMITVAREKNPDYSFVTGDSALLPYADESMDVIMACMAYPAPVRWTLNTFFRDAGFRTAGENTKAFEGTGFSTVKIVKDQYVQVLHFEKRTEDDRQ